MIRFPNVGHCTLLNSLLKMIEDRGVPGFCDAQFGRVARIYHSDINDIKAVLIIFVFFQLQHNMRILFSNHFVPFLFFMRPHFKRIVVSQNRPRIWWGATYHLPGFSWLAHAARGGSFIVGAWFGSGFLGLSLGEVTRKRRSNIKISTFFFLEILGLEKTPVKQWLLNVDLYHSLSILI